MNRILLIAEAILFSIAWTQGIFCQELKPNIELRDERVSGYLRRQRLLDNKSTLELLDVFANHQKLYDAMEFSDYQKSRISAAIADYKAKTRATEKPQKDGESIGIFERGINSSKLYTHYKRVIDGILLDHQLQKLRKCDVDSVGLKQLVLNSLIGDELKLTRRQEKEIRRGSKKLANDILAFHNNAKQRAYDVVIERLTPSQFQRLVELIDDGKINRFSQRQTIDRIYRTYKSPETQDGAKTSNSSNDLDAASAKLSVRAPQQTSGDKKPTTKFDDED